MQRPQIQVCAILHAIFELAIIRYCFSHSMKTKAVHDFYSIIMHLKYNGIWTDFCSTRNGANSIQNYENK